MESTTSSTSPIIITTHAELHIWLGRAGRPLQAGRVIVQFLCRLYYQHQNIHGN